MPPDYLAVLAASYDYEAQSEDEISITEGQLLLLLEKVDDEWWKVKIKAAQETESPVGLVPAAYVEQAEHTSVVRTLYDYEATAPGELSVTEEELLWVFETDDDWLLVQHSTDPKAGYVPGNYVEVVDESAPAAAAPRIVVPDSPPRPVAPYVDPADRVAQSRAAPAAAADEIKTWAVSEIDKKGKKKKGTLGVGNGNVYFASESDKTPVQKWQTKDVGTVVSEKAKHVRVDIAGAAPMSLHFHAGSKDHAEAIIAKLELSKSLASPPASATAPRDSPPPTEVSKKASVHFSSAEPVIIPEPEDEEEEEEAEAEEEQHEEPAPRQVSYAPPPRAPPRPTPAPVAAPEPEEAGEEEALALYDFTADGEDELSVTEGERLVVLEKDGDEWWKCRNTSGGEGVVPASYLESVPGTKASAPKVKAPTSAAPGAAAAATAAATRAAEARRAQEEADAAAEAEAEAEAEREREKAQEAAAEARKQRARKAEAQEKAKQSALAAEAQRQQRVEARASSPPVAQQSSRSKDPRTSSAAGSTTSKTSSEVNRPPPEKTRVWHDRSGQFRVEAAFLGFNNGKLRLHKVNGVIVEVPSEKMSLEDMRYVERVLEKSNRARPGSSGAPRISEDDIPLALGRNSSSADGASRAARAAAAQQEQPKKKGPTIDWFDFFLSAGCDLDDCTRYAAAFERDKLDEALLADVTEGTMRSLGLREGDILRVKKAVARRAPGENLAKPSAREEEQLRRDEELARQLQAQEGGVGSAGKPAPHLFADAQGVLKPRRGRRAGTASVPANVDIKAIAGASDQIQRTASPMSTQSPGGARTATPVLPVRPASAAAAPLISGFEDDAWTNRPSSTKPVKAMSPPPAAATPAPAPQPAPVPTPTVAPTPPAPTPSAPPSLANTTESDIFEQLAKLSMLRQTQNSAPPRPPPPPAAAPSPAFAPPVPARFPIGVGMGLGPSPVPMGHLSPPPQQPYNGPRGPFAPVPTNQSLLQPLIPVPTQPTGMFIPTKAPMMNGGGASPFGSGSMLAQPAFLNSQPTGFIPQQQQQQLMSQPTGFGHFTPSPQPMMGQPTGFNPGMQQPIMAQQTGAYGAFGGSPFGSLNQGQNGSAFNPVPLQSQMTGFRPPLNQSMFGPGPASPPPVPPLPSNAGHNTSPANVFASMKSGTFANDNDNQANTGLNGQTPVWGQTYQGYTGY